MKTLLDTIREELREKETALRQRAKTLDGQGLFDSGDRHTLEADTLADVCDLIICHEVRERAEREKSEKQ